MADDHFEPEPQTVHDYLRELRRDVKLSSKVRS